jgi:AcrR family transcriptional regulator
MAYRKTEKVLAKQKATRELLIACAIDIIGADGIEALNTRALTERAGIALGSFYLHFADAKEVVIAMASELRTRDIAAMRDAGAGEKRPIPILIAGISTLVHSVASKYRLMSDIGAMSVYRDPMQAELVRLIKAVTTGERPAILAAMAYGAIFETARLGVRSEQTLTLCLLRAIGIPAKLVDLAVL